MRYYTNEVNACVFMRNTADAMIYSPIYDEGIGTIYADVVNSYTAYTICHVALEIATNVTTDAVAEGVSFATAGLDYDKYEWHQITNTVLSVENGSIASISNGVEILKLDATEGGTAHYFRIRTQLNYYGPIRFRIRRMSHYAGEDSDQVGLIALDNIIASYPPMTIKLERYGEDYDDSLRGAEVLGCIGDFNVPFQAVGQDGVQAKIKIAWVTNNVNESQKIEVKNPKFHYRWRYLNQVVPEWSTLDFSPSEPSYLVDSSATQLVTTVDHTLNQGTGDLEYYFTADLDAQYYSVRDYANDTAVGYGPGWTEKISAVTNQAALMNPALYAGDVKLPSGGTDYFVRIREGASNMEWVQMVGDLVYTTNRADRTVEVVTNSIAQRLTLMGDHAWRYHYQIPTNAIGGTLSFMLLAKEHYTNETDSATWLIRTNELYTAEGVVTELPYTATLHSPGEPDVTSMDKISVVLDEASTHLKIEYNDEQRAFSLSRASYQSFNTWTDARVGFRGNTMDHGVSNSGVSDSKQLYEAPFATWRLCPEENEYWQEELNEATAASGRDFTVVNTRNGWTAYSGRYVAGSRDDSSNYALALDGNGEGKLGMENFSVDELPLGLNTVKFSARIAQPIDFYDFATYSDGRSLQNYAISAKVTMSRKLETDSVKPSDMSPVHPSVSFVGYYRGGGRNGGCYEFRMTRTTNKGLELALYKWEQASSGSGMKPTLLVSKSYAHTDNTYPLVPRSSSEVNNDWRSSAYFAIYTMGGKVKLEGHLSSSHSVATTGIKNSDTGLSASAIAYVDNNPGKLAQGGSYGVGSIDCSAGFGAIQIHSIQALPAERYVDDLTPAGDATINWTGNFEGRTKLDTDWDFYSARWGVDSLSYNPQGGISAVVPTNQVLQLHLLDATKTGGDWFYSGYETVVDSFSTNRFTISPRLPGSWKVRLQTGADESTGVVVDDVAVTPWEGEDIVERRSSDSLSNHSRDWVYTKSWITNTSASARVCTLQPSRGRVDYPMGLRSPYLNRGMSLFSYSYKNADSNCVLLVQISTNMAPSESSRHVPALTTSLATSGSDQVWTTIARHTFTNKSELASGTKTAFISLRQHTIYDNDLLRDVYTNVCGVIRVIVDPAVVSKVVNTTDKTERDKLIDYGRITLTKAYCYDEPAINLRSWFGFNVHTEGWENMVSGNYAYLTDWPDGLSIALNFSALKRDNDASDAKSIGLGEPTKENEYKAQNPFVQCAELTNGIGTVSFRARLFDPNAANGRAVVTLYGGTDPGEDQPTTESVTWDVLTNFVVTTPSYQAFEWTYMGSDSSPYKAIRLAAAGARHGRYPATEAEEWEWGASDEARINVSPEQAPVNRVFIDEVSVSELIVPRLKFLDVRPFHTNLGTEKICVITNIMEAEQQPLIGESWGIQCRVEPQQMADELDTDSIRVWMEVYRGKSPWGYENWKDKPVDNKTRFRSELQRVSESNLVFRSYYTFYESIMQPEEEANTVYQYVVHATYRDKSGDETKDPYTATLGASDWVCPKWYRFLPGSPMGAVNAANQSGDPKQFTAYTILDSISPYRAWINEVNICDTVDNTSGYYQFLEFAVPQRADLTGWYVKYTDYQKGTSSLFSFGIDSGVRDLTSKVGNNPPTERDHTNHYAFVSVCSPQAKNRVKNDGTWKNMGENSVYDGAFQYYLPYGLQLIRPSGIIEHEIVVQGTNLMATSSRYSGAELLAKLQAADGPGNQWIYVGEDTPDANTTLGVFTGHGEHPDCWTNDMVTTATEFNQRKDGTLQGIPYGYFLEPSGTNVWIYSTLLKPHLMRQLFGERELGANAVVVVQKDFVTNIVLEVTNTWYQVGKCTINGEEVLEPRGKTGRYLLDLGAVTNTLTILIDAEPNDRLHDTWGLTDQNSYRPAVMDWLSAEYPGYGPNDLSAAIYRDLSGAFSQPLTLTEMYWLNIPPVHAELVRGGSNVWFVAGMGSLVAGNEPVVEPYVMTMADGTIQSNVFMTVTMMITNTFTHVAAPPDRLNGLVYDGKGSSEWSGQSWTSAVFIVTGALQKPDVSNNYLPLQQYTFKPDSFGAADDSQHPFQTRVLVTDPYAYNTIGDYYGWSGYRNYPVWFRWVIRPRPEELRSSPVPLTPNWTPGTP